MQIIKFPKKNNGFFIYDNSLLQNVLSIPEAASRQDHLKLHSFSHDFLYFLKQDTIINDYLNTQTHTWGRHKKKRINHEVNGPFWSIQYIAFLKDEIHCKLKAQVITVWGEMVWKDTITLFTLEERAAGLFSLQPQFWPMSSYRLKHPLYSHCALWQFL